MQIKEFHLEKSGLSGAGETGEFVGYASVYGNKDRDGEIVMRGAFTKTLISGQLVENIMASIAQFYPANLGEETKKGMRDPTARPRATGWSGTRTAGQEPSRTRRMPRPSNAPSISMRRAPTRWGSCRACSRRRAC